MYQLFKPFYFAIILSITAFITSCSDSDAFTGTGTGAGAGTDTGTDTVIRIGSSEAGTFTDGVLLATPNTISAGGTSVITAELVDATGTAITTNNTVTFSSTCVTDGIASFSNPSFLTTTGTATTNYSAQGCTGSDIITATLENTTQTASGTVTVASATAGSVEHTSNIPASIALAGTGSALSLSETSTVTFTIRDNLGLPVEGEDITFELNSIIGGISLSSLTATSDATGAVTTTVQSGTVATNVRVTATLNSNTAISTVSPPIAIATGPPAQNSMSIAASELNPNAWSVVNKQVTISVQLGDRFSNPISDGTIISFRTELGIIDPSCTTANGGCSVTWRSGNPKTNNLPIDPLANPPGFTTILAFVEGEESFIDNDANGVFSDGDGFAVLGFDREEAFRDDNGNGAFDAGENNIDFNSNSVHDSGNNLYNGKGCIHSTLCDANADAINVWQSIELVVAENDPKVIGVAIGSGAASATFPASFNTSQNSLTFTIGGTVNEQILPVGTKITFSTTNGEITSGENHTVPNSVSSADSYTVFISGDDTSSSDGVLTMEIEMGDSGSIFNFPPIGIID
ncbi:hypothetical protein MNBD_GAMMA06-1359 [hydrothermal vent metagenome]|uniref:Big-1 domain-containing protein n=1 Tax=hydrothermal vent metagenome TaxID=652676 RepID=A0A3B0WS54_9ZZZZ